MNDITIHKFRLWLFFFPIVLSACNLSSSPTSTSPSIFSASPTHPVTADGGLPEHSIGVRVVDGVGEFYDRMSGSRFVPRGMNFIRLGSQTAPDGSIQTYHSLFDPLKYNSSNVSAELAAINAQGYNVVRVFLSQNTIGTISGGLSSPYMQNVADFIKLADQKNLYIIFTQDWIPGGKYGLILSRDCCTLFAGTNVNYLSAGGLEANRVFFQDFVRALVGLNAPLQAVFAYELRNELYFDSDQPPLSFSSGTVQTANGKTYDMSSLQDKQRMLKENLVYWIDTVRSGILELDPTSLVTVGFFQPQEPNPSRIGDTRLAVTAPAILDSQVDFIDLHAYPGIELNLQQYVENYGVNGMQAKPIVMGEFGAAVNRFSSAGAAARTLMDWQVESCNYGFDGWFLWTWDLGVDQGFYNALSGNGEINQVLSPLNRPDACQPMTFSFFENNLAFGKPVQVSTALPDQPGRNAVDGTGAQWGAGTYAPQWIEINLEDPHTIQEIRLTVAQYPEGDSTHQIWVRGLGESFRLVNTISGNTNDNQVLTFKPDAPLTGIQYVRIVTTQSPSWVSWKEIEIIGN